MQQNRNFTVENSWSQLMSGFDVKNEIDLNAVFVKEEDDMDSNENQFQCDSCSATFESKQLLTNHEKSKHPKVVEDFSADDWQNDENFLIEPENSKATNSKSKVPCKLCGKRISKLFMTKHISQTHKKQYKFRCDICYKGFYRKQRIEEHLKVGVSVKSISNCIYSCFFLFRLILERKTFPATSATSNL